MTYNPIVKANLEKFITSRFEIRNTQETHKGEEIHIICPFCHGGRNSELAFALNLDTGLSICHRASCGWKGNALQLVQEVMQCSRDTAEEILGGRAIDTTLNELIPLLEQRMKPQADAIPDEVWIKGCIPILESNSPQVNDVALWLSKRRFEGILDCKAVLDQFPIYMPPEGLYQGRVVFEVRSENVKAYQAYDYTGEQQPKTLNPSSQFLSRTLYNYDNIKNAEQPVFIHEGIFDVLRTVLERQENAVALFGTNLSAYQAYLLRKCRAKEIVVCLDSDANQKPIKGPSKSFIVAKKLSHIKPDYAQKISIMYLPHGDPDDVDDHTFEAAYMKRRIFKERSIFDLL